MAGKTEIDVVIECLAECEQALSDSIRTGKVGWMQEIAREHALKILKDTTIKYDDTHAG